MPHTEYYERTAAEADERCEEPLDESRLFQIYASGVYDAALGGRVRCIPGKLFKFPGFYIQRRTIRQYTYNSAGHALGDIGEVSMRDIEADDYYIRGDYVGKQGIEKSYEKYLRGEKE